MSIPSTTSVQSHHTPYVESPKFAPGVHCADAETAVKIDVLPVVLPKQKLIHTEWFHADCIYSFYLITLLAIIYLCFSFLIKRKGLGIHTIPKFHEMLHVVRDIRRHGPAIMYDSCITEGHHHSQKQYAARTQKRIMQFSEQTGNRLYEDQIS